MNRLVVARLGAAMLPLRNLRLGFLPRPTRAEDDLVADVLRCLAVLDAELAAHAQKRETLAAFGVVLPERAAR